MAMKLVDLAHYGRYYSYDKRRYPLWWYDCNSDKAIFIDDILKMTGIADAEVLDRALLKRNGFIPFFQFDILTLEMKYASERFNVKDYNVLKKLAGEEYDRAFMIALDSKQLLSDWYFYELDALIKSAIVWADKNRIHYDKN